MFEQASVFNQDVSKWNMGAVSGMENSKCTLSLLAIVVFFNTTTRVSSSQFPPFSHILFFLVLLLKWYFCVVLGSLAVFEEASAFNSDVSKWNTGAVTNMEHSKCNLSPFLLLCSATSPLLCLI